MVGVCKKLQLQIIKQMNNNPLSNSNFTKLFVAQIIALVGTGLSTVALSLLAYDMAGGQAGTVLGIALAFKMVAYVFFAPIIGGIVHRISRKYFMISMDALRAAIVLVMPFVSEVWHIYVLIFLLNLFSAGFKPVFQAVIPDVLNDDEQYGKALAYSRVAYDLENILSPTLAGIGLLFFTYTGLFVFNSIAFVISALIIVITFLPKPKPVERSGTFLNEVTYGIVSYFKTPRLRSLLVLYIGIALGSSMIIVNTVIYVKEYLMLSDSMLAIFFASSGLGSMLMAFTYPALAKKTNDKTITHLGIVILLISLLLMSFEPSLNFAIVTWFVVGTGLSLSQIPAGKIVNMSANPNDRTAYFSAQFSLSHLCWLFGYLAAGQLVFIFGFAYTATFFACIVAFCFIYSVLFWPKEEDDNAMIHTHTELTHEHSHEHDDHHQHEHGSNPEEISHSHEHQHQQITHKHPFHIDIHHQNWPSN